MKERDILHQNGKHWVMKHQGLYCVMLDGTTHASQIDNIGYEDISIAIRYCDYQEKRRKERTQ